MRIATGMRFCGASRRNPDSISGIGTGDSPVCCELCCKTFTHSRACRTLTTCGTRSENSELMKKHILSLLGIFVALAFIASCQQEGTTGNTIYETTAPVDGSPGYM